MAHQSTLSIYLENIPREILALVIQFLATIRKSRLCKYKVRLGPL